MAAGSGSGNYEKLYLTSTLTIIINFLYVVCMHILQSVTLRINQTHLSRQNKMAAGSGSGDETSTRMSINGLLLLSSHPVCDFYCINMLYSTLTKH